MKSISKRVEVSLSDFFERLFFSPSFKEYIFWIFLLPISWIYGSIMWLRRYLIERIDFDIPIISIGNLVVGGSGKTPFVISLAKYYSKKNVWIISRGYGRDSRGFIEVSREGEILSTVKESGDEPMEMAKALPKASVVVCEDRKEAIVYAKAQGAELIILDDGFNRVEIEKFEILLEPEILLNHQVIPAGAFREFSSTAKMANLLLKEGRDYRRKVEIINQSSKMVLVTAIARANRLDPWLPSEVVAKYILPDHDWFNEQDLKELLDKNGAKSILVTQKDLVKLDGFQLPISLMRLQLEIDSWLFKATDSYLKEYYEKKNRDCSNPT